MKKILASLFSTQTQKPKNVVRLTENQNAGKKENPFKNPQKSI